MQSSLRTVHYLPVGMDRYIDIFPTKNIDVHPSYSKKKFMPCLSLPEKKVVTLPINLILYKYNIVNIYIMYKILCMK
jgi:hypothetical protein